MHLLFRTYRVFKETVVREEYLAPVLFDILYIVSFILIVIGYYHLLNLMKPTFWLYFSDLSRTDLKVCK